MTGRDVTLFINEVKKVVKKHEISTGKYARYAYEKTELQVDEYGCADAANILYTIGEFPRDIEERKLWIETLQSMQDAETGLYYEKTHYPLHTTAHCLAALELFDALPLHMLTDLEKYKSKDQLYAFLEGLDWKNDPWDSSHNGAGLFAALNLGEESTKEWNQWYFEWLWNEADPDTGMWRKGCVDKESSFVIHNMAGTFHYLFNHEYAKMPLRYPEKLIDTCLHMYENYLKHENFGRKTGFTEIDWVYCITRALRQCNHRYEECVNVIKGFADGYLDFLLSVDSNTSKIFDDIHALFGTVCCVAELQQFLPGYIHTEKPLKLVLDRRPFI